MSSFCKLLLSTLWCLLRDTEPYFNMWLHRKGWEIPERECMCACVCACTCLSCVCDCYMYVKIKWPHLDSFPRYVQYSVHWIFMLYDQTLFFLVVCDKCWNISTVLPSTTANTETESTEFLPLSHSWILGTLFSVSNPMLLNLYCSLFIPLSKIVDLDQLFNYTIKNIYTYIYFIFTVKFRIHEN